MGQDINPKKQIDKSGIGGNIKTTMGMIKDNLNEALETVNEMKIVYADNALLQAQFKIMQMHLTCAKRVLEKIEKIRVQGREKTR